MCHIKLLYKQKIEINSLNLIFSMCGYTIPPSPHPHPNLKEEPSTTDGRKTLTAENPLERIKLCMNA